MRITACFSRWAGKSRILSATLRAAPLAALLATACAAQQSADPPASSTNLEDGSFMSAILMLRENPELREPATILCATELQSGRDESFDYRSFFGALFNVSDSEAGLTFCRAFIEVAVSEQMTAEELAAFDSPDTVKDFTVFGKMIRQLLLAHERLSSQEAMATSRI